MIPTDVPLSSLQNRSRDILIYNLFEIFNYRPKFGAFLLFNVSQKTSIRWQLQSRPICAGFWPPAQKKALKLKAFPFSKKRGQNVTPQGANVVGRWQVQNKYVGNPPSRRYGHSATAIGTLEFVDIWREEGDLVVCVGLSQNETQAIHGTNGIFSTCTISKSTIHVGMQMYQSHGWYGKDSGPQEFSTGRFGWLGGF